MKQAKRKRGDAGLFTPGVDRRNFIWRLGASAAGSTLAASAIARVSPRNSSPVSSQVMLEEMSHALFAGHVGTTFQAQFGERAVELTLVEARLNTPLGQRPAILTRRQSFSLLFRAPAGTAAPQQIYQLNHAVLGDFGLFLVPVGPDAEGMLYEAVFN
jgi:hypothetical protein